MSLVMAVVASFIVFDLGQYFSLSALQAQREALQARVEARPLASAAVFFLVYVLVTGISLPGAALLTLLGGALFGFLAGTLLVSVAATLGATLAMLISRYLLRDWLRRRFAERLAGIDRGIEREGAFYLFALRLTPMLPFVLVNLAMGLTRLRPWTFFWVSLLGMLPGTLVYVNAGRELGELDSLRDVLSPGLIGAFVLLGVFPLLARRVLDGVRSNRAGAGWTRPRHFDRNLVVIGAGSGGLVTASIASTLRARVSLIEKHRMGGDCLNTGCVPSKALIRSARLAHELRQAGSLGFTRVAGEVDFAAVMARVQRVIERIEPHDSVARYRGLDVDVIQGEAKLTSPWTVEVDGRTLTTRAVVIATGSRPRLPALPGLDLVEPLTSDTLWDLRQCPARLLILGGGPVACELAQAFQRLGSQVTLVNRSERLLRREDPDAGEAIAAALRDEGVELRLGHRALRVERLGGEQRLVCERFADEAEQVLPFDRILLALGRVANVEGFGLEQLGLNLSEDGTLETDEHLATRHRHIFAVGDVAGPFKLTHAASHQAWYAAVNALFGDFKRFKVDYRALPRAIFTIPEVAQVGLHQGQALDQGIAHDVTRFELRDLDRAITDEATSGFVKVLTAPGRDRILGVTIVGENAGELIAEYAMAIRHGLGLNKVLGTVHAYPTLAEANRHVAGQWRRAHAPQGLLRWVGRLHRWRLGRRP